MPPIDPQTAKWSALVWRLFVIAALAILACGAMGVALIANHAANNAASHANQVAQCVNDSLGVRNPITTKDAMAQKTFAHAQSRFALAQHAWAAAQKAEANALQQVLVQRSGSHAQAQAFGGFLVEHAAYNKAAVLFSQAADAFSLATIAEARSIDAVQKARNETPLGRC
jgi:hypothetical protein